MSDNGFYRAEQRVKEMNRMAQQYVRQGNNFIANADRRQLQPRFEPAPNINRNSDRNPYKLPEQTNQPKKAVQTAPPKQENSYPKFSLDNEKLLIILIMYLLIKEKADIKLIAALGYLLL